jgi:hypothetical protein
VPLRCGILTRWHVITIPRYRCHSVRRYSCSRLPLSRDDINDVITLYKRRRLESVPLRRARGTIRELSWRENWTSIPVITSLLIFRPAALLSSRHARHALDLTHCFSARAEERMPATPDTRVNARCNKKSMYPSPSFLLFPLPFFYMYFMKCCTKNILNARHVYPARSEFIRRAGWIPLSPRSLARARAKGYAWKILWSREL